MNNQLPTMDITYGTKRYNERVYKGIKTSIKIAYSEYTAKVVLLNGDTFEGNLIKVNSRANVAIFNDRRVLLSSISYLEFLPRKKLAEIEEKSLCWSSSNPSLSIKTFHLILNKAHAIGKDVTVFMGSGEIYSGRTTSHDYDSLRIDLYEGRTLSIMYDAVKRIIPLETDGSLAE
ncbi:hypothetical protein [Xenorhabdus bovienii]|uniref:hypothetical protein n=1 Tax=Xenorhabdus bovienii TaxID=40576 RepID=UPI0023B265F2|nr:hypothetical protein [Xenorhabdus bovienii]MDE9454591.1 hypothetical protein [Xenorhabdus bovienii]